MLAVSAALGPALHDDYQSQGCKQASILLSRQKTGVQTDPISCLPGPDVHAEAATGVETLHTAFCANLLMPQV